MPRHLLKLVLFLQILFSLCNEFFSLFFSFFRLDRKLFFLLMDRFWKIISIEAVCERERASELSEVRVSHMIVAITLYENWFLNRVTWAAFFALSLSFTSRLSFISIFIINNVSKIFSTVHWRDWDEKFFFGGVWTLKMFHLKIILFPSICLLC